MPNFDSPNYCGRLYNCWRDMIRRCLRPVTESETRRYRDRGITVCKSWLTYHVFRDWALSHGYAQNLTLDRRNNDRGYSPNNCRWIPIQLQAGNRSYGARKTSKYTGVHWRPVEQKWRVEFQWQGVRYNLGYFDSEVAAALAYNNHSKKIHGPTAHLNSLPRMCSPSP